MKRLAVTLSIVLGFVGVLLASAVASAQQLSLHLDSEEVYANLPFVLSVAARDFDESPAPTLSKLTIPGCRVTPLGVTPNVSSMVQIINGQRSEQRQVTFVFRFRVESSQAGQFMVPPLTAQQGSKKAQSPPGRFTIRAVDDTRDMQLRLVLPERPLWVGETIDGALEWYLRRDVGNRSFAVPLFDEEGWLEIEAPAGEPRLGGFRAGSRPLELPYDQQKATLEGTEYSRFRFQFRLTPSKPGILTPPPPRVVAELQSGMGRDMFGFPVPESKLFQAVAKPVRLEIRPLPLTGRPDSFKNAVGHSFGIEVQAGRTVVRVGDPLELRILLRGTGRLAGLILPELGAMGLSDQHFAAPEEPPSGEVLADGKGKLFRVSVRLRSQEAHEIPALSFSYFDPERGAYQTARSQPIALSVKGSAVVGAGDVVSAPAQGPAAAPSGGAKAAAGTAAPAPALIGAELALSEERLTLRRAPSLRGVLPLLVGLYGAALGLLVLHTIRRRRQAAWQQGAALQKVQERVQEELDAAARQAARDVAPRLCTALRALRKELGLPATEGASLLDRLETETYSPSAAAQPLSAALRSEVQGLVQAWNSAWNKRAAAAERPRSGGPATAALVLIGCGLGAALGAHGAARADGAGEQDLAPVLKRARAAYQAALGEQDRDRRRDGFAEVASTLRELALAHPDRPELLTDWGSAALLAQDPGRAVLAYRRALRLDPSLVRARHNLAFLRDRLPDWVPRARAGALDALLQWNQAWPVPHRHVGLAVSILLAVALWVSWPPARSVRLRQILRWLAVLPLGAGALLGLSLLTEHGPDGDAVVITSSVLRSADSLGAPAALSQPLPAGAEVSLRELRGDFTRITLANGQSGWLSSSALEPVASER